MNQVKEKKIARPAGRFRVRRIILLLAALLLLLAIAIPLAVDGLMTRRILRTQAPRLEATAESREIDGAKISYRRLGESGETLLLVHGFMGSSWDFHQIMPELARQYQVIAVDQIGFGLSDKSLELDYTKENSARLIGLFMQDLGIERYHVLGHSMGGEVALRMALANPAAIERLILLNSAGLTDPQAGRSAQIPEWLIDTVFQNYLLQRLVFSRTVTDRSVASAENFNDFFYFNKQIPAATLARMTRQNDSGAIADRINQVGQPALVVWGREDAIIPLAQGEKLAELLPQSRLIILENCGHLPYLEKPQRLTSLILDYLAE